MTVFECWIRFIFVTWSQCFPTVFAVTVNYLRHIRNSNFQFRLIIKDIKKQSCCWTIFWLFIFLQLLLEPGFIPDCFRPYVCRRPTETSSERAFFAAGKSVAFAVKRIRQWLLFCCFFFEHIRSYTHSREFAKLGCTMVPVWEAKNEIFITRERWPADCVHKCRLANGFRTRITAKKARTISWI